MSKKGEYKLEEIAGISGVPARTIRLYISRGLLAGPLRSGRDAAYGEEHIEALGVIRDLQVKGLTLEEIRLNLSGGQPHAVIEPSTWTAFNLSDDVTVLVRNGISPWRTRQIRTALNHMAESISIKSGKDE